jgi:hypothetical protein
MHLPTTPNPLDLIPDPAKIHRQISANARTQRLLRRLLKLSLTARREREEMGQHTAEGLATTLSNGGIPCQI